MTWLTIVRGLRQRWWLLIVCPLATILAVYIATSGADDTYRSETTMVIAPTAIPGDSFSTIDALRILEDRTIQGTFVEVASDDATVDGAAAQLGIDAARREDFDVLPTIPVGSNLIEVAIVGPDALATQQLCQLVVDSAITRFATLYPMYTIQVLQPAVLPTDPQQQTGSQELALAMLLGLGAAVLIAALWRRTEDLLPNAAGAAGRSDSGGPVATPLAPAPEQLGTAEPGTAEPGTAEPGTAEPGTAEPATEASVAGAQVAHEAAADLPEPAPIFKRRPTRVRRLADERPRGDSPAGADDSRAAAD